MGDLVDAKGWFLNRNTEPSSLHVMLSPAHGPVAAQLVADIAEAVATCRASGTTPGQGGREVRYS